MRRLFWTMMVLGLSLGYFQFAIGADSPVGKNSWIINGGATFSSLGGELYTNSKGDRSALLILYPSAGIFVAPSLNFGAQLLYARASSGGDAITVAGIGPRLTYYFEKKGRSGSVKGRTYPYLTGSFIYGSLSPDGDDDKTTLTAFSFGGGITQMLANSIGIYGELNYRLDKIKDNYSSEKGNSVNIFAGFTLFLWE